MLCNNVYVRSMRKIGANENHIKMELEDAYGILDALALIKVIYSMKFPMV